MVPETMTAALSLSVRLPSGLHLVLVTDDTFMPVGNVHFIEFVVTR